MSFRVLVRKTKWSVITTFFFPLFVCRLQHIDCLWFFAVVSKSKFCFPEWDLSIIGPWSSITSIILSIVYHIINHNQPQKNIGCSLASRLQPGKAYSFFKFFSCLHFQITIFVVPNFWLICSSKNFTRWFHRSAVSPCTRFTLSLIHYVYWFIQAADSP